MEIKRMLIPRMTIEKFADDNGLVMEVHERRTNNAPDRYYAHFSHCDVAEDGMLVGTFGNGATEEGAIKEYAGLISQKTIIINAFSATGRREILVPTLMGE